MSSEGEATTAVGGPAPPMREVDELARGSTLGRYVVLSCLGMGGMGVVYACYDPNLDRKVALKLLYAGDEQRSLHARERLVQEAQALARLSHPNVVAVHDVDEVRGRVYLAMEFVEGQTLGAWGRVKRRPWAEVLDVYVQAARGLAAAHDVGLVHRDFKPDNVMLGIDGRVRVMDFGLARAIAEPTQSDPEPGPASGFDGRSGGEPRGLTATGAVMGTPAYMAPEQHLGHRPDAKADQFAFCVSLHEALFGERPFRADSLVGLRVAVTEGRQSEVTDDRDVPRWLRRVIARGLAVAPDDRFASMHALLRELSAGRARQARSRWVLAAAGGGVVVASVFGVRALAERRAIERCARQGEAISEVWNDDARNRLQGALASASLSYAVDTFERATPWLDQAASTWESAREDVCRRFEVDRAISPEVHDRALACLDEHRLRLELLLESTIDDAASGAARLVMAAATLEPATDCGDASSLARKDVPAPEHRAEVAELRRELLRADALSDAGRFDAAARVVEPLWPRALATEWAPIIVPVALQRGSILEAKGDYAAAEAALREAFERGWAAGRDEDVTDAAQQLAFLHAYELGRPEEGQRWGRLAELSLARLGDRDRAHRAGVLGTMSVVHAGLADLPTAIKESEAALATVEAQLGAEHPAVASALTNLGGFRVQAGELDLARAAIERALRIRERTLGPRHPDVASVLNNLAGLHHAAGDAKLAEEAWTGALAIWEDALGPEHAQVALVLKNLAILHRQSGELDEAKRVAERALAIREKVFGAEHPLTAELEISAAWLRSSLGDHASARTMIEHALKAQEREWGPEHPDLALGLDRLARVLVKLGEREAAGDAVRRAIAIVQKVSAEDERLVPLRAQLAKIETGEGQP